MRRRIFFRWLFYGTACVLFALLQSLLLNRLSLWGIHPFLLPALIAVAAAFEARRESVVFALFLGFFCDLAMPGIIPCFYELAFTLCALLSSFVSRRLIVPGLVCSMVCCGASTVFCSVLYALLFAYSHSITAMDALFLVLRELLMSAPCFLPVHFVFQAIHRRFRRD